MAKSRQHSRRRFMAQTAGLFGIPYFIPSTVLGQPGKPGANERVAIGLIGAGRRGNQLIDGMPAAGRIVAICDCYTQRIENTLRRAKAEWAPYQDYRRMFDDQKLDAVMVVIPDHNHAFPTIDACQRGLDIYCEKPLGLTIAEGRAMVQAVRQHERVCQIGTQQRSIEVNRFVCEFVRNGGLGDVHTVLIRNHPGPIRYAGLPEEPVPEGLDWDRWCGQAPLRPYNSQLYLLHPRDGKGWFHWHSYSGGIITNNGTHGVDMIQYALGADQTGPTKIWLTGEPDLLPKQCRPVRMQYADGTVVRFEPAHNSGPLHGAIFVGERAKMQIQRNGFRSNPADLVKDAPAPVRGDRANQVRDHIQNWIDCIATRKRPRADVEIGHRSTTACMLANIARELGRPIRWDPEQEVFPGDDEANDLLDRPRRAGYELPGV